jgi:hypothetical protein
VDVDSSTEGRALTSLTGRVLHVSAYVDLSLDVVLERFAPPEVDELLAAAVRAGLGQSDEATVGAWAGAPTWVSAGHVRVPVRWCIDQPARFEAVGAATVSLLVVQTGEDAITELLVTVPAPDGDEGRAAAVLHEILHELTRLMEASAR